MTKLIVNCETNEIVERELNKAEKDQQKIDEVKALEIKAEEQAKAAQKAVLLERLGISQEEVKLLLS